MIMNTMNAQCVFFGCGNEEDGSVPHSSSSVIDSTSGSGRAFVLIAPENRSGFSLGTSDTADHSEHHTELHCAKYSKLIIRYRYTLSKDRSLSLFLFFVFVSLKYSDDIMYALEVWRGRTDSKAHSA